MRSMRKGREGEHNYVQNYDLLDDGRSISTETLVNKIVNKGDLDKVNK